MLEHNESLAHKLTARISMLFVMLVAIASLTACGGSSGDDEFRDAVKVNDLNITSITISSPNTVDLPSVIEVSAEEAFTAMAVIDSGASASIDITDQVKWTSSNTAFISISASGLAVAKSDGSVVIKAQLADLSASKDLTASSAELTGVAISSADALTDIGVCTLNHKYTAIGTYDDGRESDVTASLVWASSNEAVAIIDNEDGNEGGVSALTVGDSVISAEHQNGTVSNNLDLAVIDTLDMITVTPETSSLTEGGSQQFVAIGSYSDLVDDQDITTTVTWSTANTDLVVGRHLSISNEQGSKGLATTITDGEADVTASCGDNTTSVPVVINDPVTITSIKINDDRDLESGEVGDSPIELRATIQYSDGSADLDVTDDANTTWSIESVLSGVGVTLSDDGVATITGIGSTRIKVAYDDGVASKTANIDIDIE